MGLSIFYTANRVHMSYSTHMWWDPRAGSYIYSKSLSSSNLSRRAARRNSSLRPGGMTFAKDLGGAAPLARPAARPAAKLRSPHQHVWPAEDLHFVAGGGASVARSVCAAH
jgi:hypothetical protein